MKNFFLLLIILFKVTTSTAQINLADSTVQVISYWDKGEKHTYIVSTEKSKVKGDDTTSNVKSSYKVDITVIDSTAKTYTVEWSYHDVISNDTSKLVKRLSEITNDIKIIYKTDEMGIFLEVVNWKEIKEAIQKTCSMLKKEYNHIPGMNKIIDQVESTYATREAIETTSVKDIKQFHSFHGAKYLIHNEVTGTLKVPNIFGDEPFDSNFSVFLDEINGEENNYIIRSAQEVDREQLRNSTFKYLTEMSKNLRVDPPVRSELGDLKNEILLASRIHGSGWPIYSIMTTTISSDESTNIEERIIEIE